jgi:hypothetical protein
MRRVEPPRAVLVHRDGRWHDGELRAWRKDLDGWLGFVCYAESAGLRWLEWVPVERVRPSWAVSFPNMLVPVAVVITPGVTQ